MMKSCSVMLHILLLLFCFVAAATLLAFYPRPTEGEKKQDKSMPGTSSQQALSISSVSTAKSCTTPDQARSVSSGEDKERLNSASETDPEKLETAREVQSVGSPVKIALSDEDRKMIDKFFISFAISFFKTASRDIGSFVFSPLSIALVLAMLHEGSDGATKTELSSLLGDAIDPSLITAYYTELIDFLASLSSSTSGVTTKYTSALFVDKKILVDRQFAETLKNSYKASVDSIDFCDGQVAVEKINKFVRESTQGLITKIVDSDSFESTVAMVVNCIYFKGAWNQSFEAKDTTEASFFGINEKERNENFMNKSATKFSISIDSERSVISLPYQDDRFSMLIMMPARNFVEWKNGLSADAFEKILSSLYPRDINLAMPKFNVTQKIDCKEILETLGVRSSFGPTADFSKMTTSREMFISKFNHNATIEVSEEGTTAAAVTNADWIEGPHKKPIDVRIDKPFIFVVMDHDGFPMFIGEFV